MTDQDKKKYIRLRKINVYLARVVLVICIYFISFPYLPELSYAATHVFASVERYSVSIDSGIPSRLTDAIATKSRVLYIPAIDVREDIIEANDIGEVHEKIWRRPKSATPATGSNTVLAAHRYATIGGIHGSTFYNLPKLGEGDVVYVAWDGDLYIYIVEKTKVVTPDHIEIEGPSETPMITLYTCTPLWSAKERFVVEAHLINTIVWQ